MLQFAEKYNWWTAKDQKKHLSIEAKLEYLLERAPLDELVKALHEVGGAKLFEVWESRVKNKALPRRKKVIDYFVETHKNYKNED